MSKKTKAQKERDVLVANLQETWPEGNFEGVSNTDLLWLAEVANLRRNLHKRPMSEVLSQFRPLYENSATPKGRASKRCGDELSVLLTGLDADTAIRLAEKLLDLETDFLMAKYSSLNEGQRRMNAGNRIRGGLKREDISIKDVKAAMKAA